MWLAGLPITNHWSDVGEIILDFDIINSWDSELDKMNDGKKGAIYDYPDSFVQLPGYMKAYFHLPFRQTEGVVRAHAANKLPSIPHTDNKQKRSKQTRYQNQ